MNKDYIQIINAQENNLKNISLDIPKYKLIALTGVSGSGKSSLAIEILQKECQRQYMESMGLVTDGLNKPNVESIVGLSPAIAIRQRVLSNNPKSTVGTYTEILTYLRLLFAKFGIRECENCHSYIYPSFDESNELDQTQVVCSNCKHVMTPLKMADFSFNKPEGACSKCQGLGVVKQVDYSKIIDENLTIKQGALKIYYDNEVMNEHYSNVYENCGKHYGFVFDVSKPVKEFNELEKLVLYKGVDSEAFTKLFPNIKKPKRVSDGYVEGLETYIQKKLIESNAKKLANPIISNSITEMQCDECHGSRLGFIGRTTTVLNQTIVTVSNYTIDELIVYINKFENSIKQDYKEVATVILESIKKKCNSIVQIGLSYLSISRSVSTLSGGESQRLKLTNITESGLTGVLYILDEPTTGLHPSDSELLLTTLYRLRDLGNTVIVIEHDMDFVKKCDYVIDFGPYAGSKGGQIVAKGTPSEISNFSQSLTGKYINQPLEELSKKAVDLKHNIEIINANQHNLKGVSVKIPLHCITTFTGVSGSGKSSLMFDVLDAYYHNKPTKVDKIIGLEHVDHMITIDQKPIGRMTRSNVATYTEVYTLVRELFSKQKLSKQLKLKSSDFSFNVKGGRCEHCQGLGVIALNMQFLDDVEVICPICKGDRFKKEILSVEYNGKNISNILDTTIDDLVEFFDVNEIKSKLLTIQEVGLGYLKLGQSTTTLSGGECQRLKLSKELAKSNSGRNLYLFDEPTTGLHPADIDKIMVLFKKLIMKKHTVLIIEHCLSVIAQSDYLIDIGPKGGVNGGVIIAKGSPSELKENPQSSIGKYL